ncbi:MAG: hypothetical protein HY812_05515 [Planctomycetes bacterium]|nr:hypothetical protein [Planctomycetota bacterium]
MVRRLVKVLVALAAACALLQGAVWVLEARGFFAARIRAVLARYASGAIEVGGADLDLLSFTVRARDLKLGPADGDGGSLVLPSAEFRLPLSLARGGDVMPERVDVVAPLLRLRERAGGGFSPLDLLKPWVPTAEVPVVAVSAGSIILEGEGPLSALLDGLLRADLERRIEDVRFVTFPQPPASSELIGLSGTLALPGAGAVSLSGGLARDQSFRLTAGLRGLDLAGERLLAALNPRLRAFLAGHAVQGTIDLSATMEGAVKSGAAAGAAEAEAPGVRALLALRDLSFQHEALAAPISAPRAEAFFDGFSLRLHEVRIPNGASALVADGVWHDVLHDGEWRLTLDAPSLTRQDPLVQALVHPGIRQAIDDFSPEGSCAFCCEVTRPAGGGELAALWRIAPIAASASYAGHADAERPGHWIGFPYRLRDLTGEISGEGALVRIRSLRGRHNGGGHAVIDGFVDARAQGTAYEVRVTGDAVPVDAELQNALERAAPGSGAVIDRFAPEGAVDIDVMACASLADEDATVRGRVTARGGKVRLADFPLPLGNVAGAVEFDGDLYRIVGVTGEHGETRVHVAGTVDARGADVGLDLRISAASLQADDAEFRAALERALADAPADCRGLFSLLNVSGSFDLELEILKEPGGETRFRAVIFPRDMEIVPSWLPIPVKGVWGRVVLGNLHDRDRGDTRFYAHLDQLRGRLGEAEVLGWGRRGEGMEESLHLVGRSVRLSDALLEELVAAAGEAVEREGRPALGMLRGVSASGDVSFHYRHGAAPGQEPGGDTLDLRLEGVACASDVLPGGGLRELTGRALVDFAAGQLDLYGLDGRLADPLGRVGSEHLRLSLGESCVHLSGDIDLDAKPFSPELSPLVPPGLRDFLRSRQPSGSFRSRLSSFDAELLWPGDGRPAELGGMSFAGEAEFTDCRIGRPLALSGISGRLGLSGSGSLAPQGEYRIEGSLSNLALQVGVLTFHGLGADLSATRDVVEVTNLGGRFAGGVLPAQENYVRVETAPQGRIEGNLTVRDADLALLAREVVQLPGEISGRVTLEFGFQGAGEGLGGVGGGGTITIEDGRLWELPLFARLYEFSLGLAVAADEKPTFQQGRIDYRLAGGMLVLDRFELKAPVARAPVGLTLSGRGVVGPTGVDLRVVPQVISLRLPFLSPAIDQLKRGLINYRIYGPLANPRVSYWNAAIDVMAPNQDVTRLPRLAPRKAADWGRRF